MRMAWARHGQQMAGIPAAGEAGQASRRKRGQGGPRSAKADGSSREGGARPRTEQAKIRVKPQGTWRGGPVRARDLHRDGASWTLAVLPLAPVRRFPMGDDAGRDGGVGWGEAWKAAAGSGVRVGVVVCGASRAQAQAQVQTHTRSLGAVQCLEQAVGQVGPVDEVVCRVGASGVVLQ